MTRVYRVYRGRRRDTAFTGDGAAISGARWNLPGTSVVYACSTLSLCLLELFVHLDPEAVDLAALGLEYRWADLPSTVPRLDTRDSDLPKDWNALPWPESTQRLGTTWMAEGRHAVVSVPSVIVPLERNFLLNPGHPAFSEVRLGSSSVLRLDPRLFAR